MKIREIVRLLDCQVLVGREYLDNEVIAGCGCDLMSDVLAFIKLESILLTGLNNPQVIRTAEIAEIMDSDVTDSMKDDDLFLVDPAAGGISFTENNSGDCDPFYANEEASVGMRFPWFTRDLNPALTLEWWREHFGTGAEAAVESRGPREVKRRQLDPVIKDFFGGGSDEARNRLAVLLTAGCEEDEDAKRIMDWACAPNGNGEREKVYTRGSHHSGGHARGELAGLKSKKEAVSLGEDFSVGESLPNISVKIMERGFVRMGAGGLFEFCEEIHAGIL